MKTPLIITASLLLLFSIGYVYSEFGSKQEIQPWDIVPRDAILVYEGGLDQIGKGAENSSLKALVLSFGEDSLPESRILRKVTEGKKNLISLHLTRRDGFDIVTYTLLTKMDKELFDQSQVIKKGGAIGSRLFEGSSIRELKSAKNKTVSIVLINNVLVMSQTPFLIEDVIRKSLKKESVGFKADNSTLFSYVKMEADNGNLYVDIKQFSRFQNLFLSRKDKSIVTQFFGNSMLIDLKIKDNLVLMNGFALDSTTKPSVLSMFNDQRPVSFDLKSILPAKTSFLAHYGISDFSRWTMSRNRFCEFHNRSVLDSLKQFEKKFGTSTNSLKKSMGDEVAQFNLKGNSNEFFVIETGNKDLVAGLDNINNDSTYNESYSGYRIRRSKFPQLVRTLFWPLTEQSHYNFYTPCGKYILFSKELDGLKLFLDDVDSENTWTKSTEWNKFLESTAQETNISFFFSDALFPELEANLTAGWRTYADSVNYFNLSKGAFQFSRLDQNYYFNGTIAFSGKTKPLQGKGQQKSISFSSIVKSNLFPVKNHSNGSTELLMQDELNSLSLVSKDLEVLWKIEIEKRIKGGIHQIDFYKNRKLQYFFATDNQLHLIDRLGKYVIGFPREIVTGTGVEFTTVVDYDNSKNYRFIIGDVSGKLFMFDKQGKVLPGWQPNRAGKHRILSLQHFKIAGKDYLMAIDENGAVYSFSRKGDLIKKFPLELNSRSHQGMLYKSRDDEKLFYFVTSDGFVIQFDGQGKIYKSDALVKSSVDSKYSLVSSQDGSTCVISRTDKGKIAVLNLDGTILFEAENQGSEKIVLISFSRGQGKALFCFWDIQQEFAYLYDENGKLVSGKPFECSVAPIVAPGKDSQLILFSVYKNRLSQFVF